MRTMWLIFITVILLLLMGCGKQDNSETAASLAQWAIKEIEVKDNHINLADYYPGLDVTFTWSIDQPDRIDFTKNILVPTSVEVTVLLTVTVNYQGENVSESASIVIEALEPGEEPGEEPVEEPDVDPNEEPDVDPDVFNEADEIAIEFISQISRFIRQDYYITTEFPDFGGSSVTWESSHPEYFSHEGKYTAPFIDVVITISYTVMTTTPALTKSFSKEFTVYKMNNFERNNFIKKYLQDNLTSNGLLKLTDILPTSIGVPGVTLSWYDANKTLVTSLSDVTTYIIPNVGVDLRLKVVTSDYQFELPIRYQTLESNLQAVMRTITSVDLVKEMKVGWNLGNTFDSPSETGWGNPQTTKAMIDTVKAAGFNVLRFPVTWEGHFAAGGDYLIDEDWINRVQELINYAIDKNTFVILNMHHERWNSTSYLNKDRASLIMEKLWLQIGTRFAAYDEHLIFEGMNEPRIYEASDSIQWGGNAEAFAVINHLNQVFVSTIRSLGGNNQYRHLMVTGNGGGASEAVLANLVVPNDRYVIVSVHAYTPYDFAHDKTTVTSWSKNNSSQTNEIDALFNRLNDKFVRKNIAVIMGEFASRDKANIASRIEWLEYYLQKATSIGVPCVWWDTGQVKTPENMTFSIFNRTTKTWLFPEIVRTLMTFSRQD